jgi:nucleoside-diphosphate-sugar epimerase
VKDITADGAFDEAVQGVDGVAHTAAVVGSPEDPKGKVLIHLPEKIGTEYFGQTLSILQSKEPSRS